MMFASMINIKIIFASIIRSKYRITKKKEKIFEYPFVEKKNIFKIRLINYFFKTN